MMGHFVSNWWEVAPRDLHFIPRMTGGGSRMWRWCHLVSYCLAPDHTWSYYLAPGHIAWHLVMHLAGGNCVMMASGQWPYTWQMMASGNGIYSVTPDLYMSGNWLRPIGCICVFFNKVALDLECHIWFLCVPYLVSYDGFSIAKKKWNHLWIPAWKCKNWRMKSDMWQFWPLIRVLTTWCDVCGHNRPFSPPGSWLRRWWQKRGDTWPALVSTQDREPSWHLTGIWSGMLYLVFGMVKR